jgi:hypothetical protein
MSLHGPLPRMSSPAPCPCHRCPRHRLGTRHGTACGSNSQDLNVSSSGCPGCTCRISRSTYRAGGGTAGGGSHRVALVLPVAQVAPAPSVRSGASLREGSRQTTTLSSSSPTDTEPQRMFRSVRVPPPRGRCSHPPWSGFAHRTVLLLVLWGARLSRCGNGTGIVCSGRRCCTP